MARTANGFGTLYFGPSEVHEVIAPCAECGASGPLFCFEANVFAVAFMLPVLPLGRRQVLRYCAQCHAHYDIPLKKWRQLVEDTVARESDTLQNAEAPDVAAALRRVMDLDDAAAFQRAAAWAEGNANAERSPLVQSVLGGGAHRLGQHDTAAKHLRSALSRRDDPQVLRLLVETLLPLGAFKEAWRLLRPHLTSKNDDLARLAQKTVTAAQQVDPTLPHSLDDDERDELLDEAQRLGVYSVTLLPELTSPPFPFSETWVGRVLPYATWPLLCTLGFTLFLMASVLAGNNQPVLVISGVPRAYDVVVGEQRFRLPPLGQKKVYLPQGEHDVRVVDDVDLAAARIEVRSPLLTRLFENSLDVVNPDHGALLSDNVLSYSTVGLGQAKRTLRVGELHQRFVDADFKYGAPPTSILVEGSDEVVRRTILQHVPADPATVVQMLQSQLGVDVARQWLRDQLRFSPHDERLWRQAQLLLPTDEAAQRMLQHPFGQIAYGQALRNDDVDDKRRALETSLLTGKLDANEVYLLAVLTTEVRRREALVHQASTMSPPSAFALRERALLAAKEGRIRLAMQLIEAAAKQAPSSRTVHQSRLEIAALAGAAAEVDAAYLALARLEPWTIGHLLYFIGFRGGTDKVSRKRIRTFVQESERSFGTVVAAHHRRVLAGATAYYEGALDVFRQQVQSVPGWRLDAQLSDGQNWAAALQTAQATSADELHVLALWVGAKHTGANDVAAEAEALLAQRAPATAALLQSTSEPRLEHMRTRQEGLTMYGARLLAVSTLLSNPDEQQAWRQEAERFFVFRMPPQHVFDRVLGGQNGATP